MTGHLHRVGDRVADRNRVGTVEHVGPCGWHGCQFGDRCVTVRFDGAFTTENRAADTLECAPS